MFGNGRSPATLGQDEKATGVSEDLRIPCSIFGSMKYRVVTDFWDLPFDQTGHGRIRFCIGPVAESAGVGRLVGITPRPSGGPLARVGISYMHILYNYLTTLQRRPVGRCWYFIMYTIGVH